MRSKLWNENWWSTFGFSREYFYQKQKYCISTNRYITYVVWNGRVANIPTIYGTNYEWHAHAYCEVKSKTGEQSVLEMSQSASCPTWNTNNGTNKHGIKQNLSTKNAARIWIIGNKYLK